jgi:hypothetical protein
LLQRRVIVNSNSLKNRYSGTIPKRGDTVGVRVGVSMVEKGSETQKSQQIALCWLLHTTHIHKWVYPSL